QCEPTTALPSQRLNKECGSAVGSRTCWEPIVVHTEWQQIVPQGRQASATGTPKAVWRQIVVVIRPCRSLTGWETRLRAAIACRFGPKREYRPALLTDFS